MFEFTKIELGLVVKKSLPMAKENLNTKFYRESSNTWHDENTDRIDTIVIGYNQGWKQKSSMGKKNNQNFVNIPFKSLVQQLQYKAEDEGIRVELVDEAYTSKCSFLDDEPLQKHSHYLGTRVKRGKYLSKNHIILNADCNSAGNIGRKVFPLVFTSGTVDALSHPVSLTV